MAADAILLAAVAVLLLKLRSLGRLPQLAQGEKLSDFFKEAQDLSQEFDRLLAEKRKLAQSTLDSLDKRIADLKKTAAGLERPPAPKARPASRASRDGGPMEPFRQTVLKLAGQGKNPAQIAQATGKPRGEVELVLDLEAQKSK